MPPGLGPPSDGKHVLGTKFGLPLREVLVLPGMGKNCLGTKFGPPVVRAYFNVPAGTFVPGEMKNVPGDLAVRAL